MIQLHHGDCLDVLRTMPDASVDAIVTDPPYGLRFMGKKWDYDVPTVEVWAECLRVLKPGGHLLAFAGTRTQHRMAVRIEDAGFEIRDMIAWVYGSGFPKSHNVAIGIDKMYGAPHRGRALNVAGRGNRPDIQGPEANPNGRALEAYAPATDAARQWDGWGTALKPALEPVTVARKPLEGTVAANVLQWGTGGINVDGCRVGTDLITQHGRGDSANIAMSGRNYAEEAGRKWTGRWPANLIHDGSDEVVGLFPETKPSRSQDGPRGTRPAGFGNVGHVSGSNRPNGTQHDDAGGSAARFFYTAKTSKADREYGLDRQRIVYVSCPLWENEDHKAKLRVDMGLSRPRVIAVSGAPCNDATVWSTFLFGSDTTAPYLTATKSTTETVTSSTTEWTTSNSFRLWLTSGCTEDANGEVENGGSRVASAGRGTPSITITSAWTVSVRGVERASSPTPFTISAGGSPADHPTVKPVDLMCYLCRLVTPPGGIVLDPFMGSGSTGKACVTEGFSFIGIERDADSFATAQARVVSPMPLFKDVL